MSRAFVREDDAHSTDPELPEDEAPAPVTAHGMVAFRARLAALRSDPSQVRAAAHLARRLDRLIVVDAPGGNCDRVLFGSVVTVEDDDGERTVWRVVGPDETGLVEGGVSVSSPVAKALLGRRVGDAVRLVAPRGARELTIVSVR